MEQKKKNMINGRLISSYRQNTVLFYIALSISIIAIAVRMGFMISYHNPEFISKIKPTHDEGFFFKNSQGLWLYGIGLFPSSSLTGGDCKDTTTQNCGARGIIFVCHGIHGHSSSLHYMKMYDTFINEGYVTLAMDYQGHGRSDGERGYYTSINQVVDDYELFINYTLAHNPQLAHLPRMVFGHSFGGMVGIKLGARKPTFFTGMILSAPAIQPHFLVRQGPSAFVNRMILYLAQALAPKFPINPLPDGIVILKNENTDYENLLPDHPDYVDELRVKNNLRVNPIVDLFQTQFKLIDKNCCNGKKKCNPNTDTSICHFSTPFLSIQPTLDMLCEPEGAEYLEEMNTSEDVEIHYVDAFHDWSDYEYFRIPIMKEIFEWLNSRCPPLNIN